MLITYKYLLKLPLAVFMLNNWEFTEPYIRYTRIYAKYVQIFTEPYVGYIYAKQETESSAVKVYRSWASEVK